MTLLEWIDVGDHFCLPGGGRDETVWFVFACRRDFLEGWFLSELEVSDLVAESQKCWVIRVEGNGVDDFEGAFCLLS